ncbi:PREDICTED: venom acid phosphatase Acph-1-like [Trachymyrmex septentrionalis]|uniref:venom acid phosphatase Acph-1-like n=1 Tax=Trachymyrmex septentrionalis TaxID=34720 RepID=UPI00084F0BFA|nr:PREDICTED: venom acid phosphatase Acph-1-like [Trachymyrmex septentrionalis]
MEKFRRLLSIALIFYSCLLTTSKTIVSNTKVQQDDYYLTLRLVSTVFRHGDRTVDKSSHESYPNDPYNGRNFYPVGDGDLTNAGKKRAYELGLLLRDKYNKFLGDLYYPPNVYARSTWVTRTKMTLQLVLAGLYPPVEIQKWNSELSWQPVDMIYFPIEEDDLLFPIKCSIYNDIYKKVIQNAEVKEKIEQFDNLMKITSKYTGTNVTNLLDLVHLYSVLRVESSMGLTLPEWTQDIFPNGKLLNATLLFFNLLSYDQLNNLNGGVLLNRLINDMNKAINGTLHRKINLFSAHDMNVFGLLLALNISEPHLPEFTSSVIIELHEKNEKYFVKILHYLGIPPKILEVTIPGCEVLCPYDKFIKLTKNTTGIFKSCYPENQKMNKSRAILTPFETSTLNN